MTLLNVGFSSYSFTKKMLSETCWGKNFVWKIFAPLLNGNAKTRFCTTEPRPEWKKSKLKINGMRMRNLLRSLSEAEISSSRRRSREKKKRKQLDATLALKIVTFPWIVYCERRRNLLWTHFSCHAQSIEKIPTVKSFEELFGISI